MKFMHDNSPIYTASTIGTWLEENDIPLVDWLPYSLEFNPVDQGWAELEERIYMLYLVLEKFDGTKKSITMLLLQGDWKGHERV